MPFGLNKCKFYSLKIKIKTPKRPWVKEIRIKRTRTCHEL